MPSKRKAQEANLGQGKIDYEKLGGKVMAFVRKKGKVTRSEAANLCRIDSLRARNLLMQQSSKGLLAKRGETKGAYYVLAGETTGDS